ncbi:helix-turn-helix domain-containing protein [Priestia megaterium]|uniref:helix-turn-helix domain-containing protein n=1 Tax=Priestia megaterium TaxID=1404 RepID=UPI001FB23DFB|nr:helix-turn-helix transcriptional regulator [Priestia megaterium]
MNLEDKKLLGERIRSCRIQAELSQDGLATILGMKRTNIANYEAGRVIPPGNVLVELAETFGVPTDYLLGITDDPFSNGEIDDDIREIQRAARKMNNKDRKKMLDIIKLTFEEAFDDDEDDDDDI